MVFCFLEFHYIENDKKLASLVVKLQLGVEQLFHWVVCSCQSLEIKGKF